MLNPLPRSQRTEAAGNEICKHRSYFLLAVDALRGGSLQGARIPGPPASKRLPGERTGLGFDRRPRSGENQFAARVAAARTEIDDPISQIDDVEIVLEH